MGVLPTVAGGLLFVVPNALSEAINAELDRALVGIEVSDEERKVHYSTLLRIFHETGQVPTISSVTKRDTPVNTDSDTEADALLAELAKPAAPEQGRNA